MDYTNSMDLVTVRLGVPVAAAIAVSLSPLWPGPRLVKKRMLSFNSFQVIAF